MAVDYFVTYHEGGPYQRITLKSGLSKKKALSAICAIRDKDWDAPRGSIRDLIVIFPDDTIYDSILARLIGNPWTKETDGYYEYLDGAIE